MAGIKQLTRVKSTKGGGATQDSWLLDLFEEHLTEEQTSTRSGCFFPSLLGSSCDRHLYLAYRGLLPSAIIASHTRRIFDNGSYLEERMTSYFEKMGVLEDREVRLACDDPPISGRADFILTHPIHSKIVVELKSINDKGFNNLRGKPKKEHMVQIQLYLHLLQMEHGIVLYENKNDQHIKVFEVERSEKAWKTIEAKCRKIQNMESLPKACTGPPWCPCKNYKETEEKYDGEMDSYESLEESG